jgi:AcrR family transcriptional regulator
VSTRAGPAISTRERIVTVASQIVADENWASLTMSRLALEAGVSRQTVYNEFGSKPKLAEAVVLNEMARFLEIIEASFARYPGDLMKALERTIREVLARAEENVLVQGVVSASQGSVTEDFLPYLTTQSETLVDATGAVLRGLIESYPHGLAPEDLAIAVDVIVRMVLSHMMSPEFPPKVTARRLSWALAGVFRTSPGHGSAEG